MSCETVEKLIIQEKEVVSSLYRHQELKKAFMQFGSKFRLPDEIVFKLYKMIQESIQKDEEMVRLYHKNMLLYNTLSHTIKVEEIDSQVEKDALQYLIPDGRGCEWAIQKSFNKKIVFNDENGLTKFKDIREKLFFEINILGETGYLLQDGGGGGYRPAKKESIILYLNTSPFEEVYLDYSNFNEWKGTVHESAWTLVLDNHGDSYFIPH